MELSHLYFQKFTALLENLFYTSCSKNFFLKNVGNTIFYKLNLEN
ncbi:hypothetical protein LEP1GSC083_5242 [Leptospira interrogans serovar Pyrogenes str. L0374]|uniref:Uncharacterized protein n=4 Tax=Leptospira interrogans TaxID=173 RepID=M6K1J2_LEPIR|nr:hypothetical protein LEP1GSC045_4018 [Leptospira interrogans serovar Pomona str. Kennewicki LC82-25]EJP16360.1 hypothetical protein LEP1GSC080_0563 [Leptospira interrogans str. FPW2026]EKN97437.1 hypothetical protein LEP1GSC014_2358 [Leptospira interrogans serovar Pomona str. Pomona]EKO68458.1 hypothetical protein LEP1GSC069_2240 [Leptospira interrogans serovar Canicola str. Fiocruz LV133]EKR36569.1 hypothetical protein LEP1GSC096_0364 [Leptospira interrogans serovar Hebdomadis str. R499]EM